MPLTGSPVESIYREHSQKKHTKLVEDIKYVFNHIFHQSFCHKQWYRNMRDKISQFIAMAHQYGLSNKTFFGNLPCSGVFFSESSNASGVNFHIDNNAFGASFVLCTQKYASRNLVVTSKHNCIYHANLNPGEIMGGSWSLQSHGTEITSSDLKDVPKRRSWVLYFDRRILKIDGYRIVQ